MEGRQGAGVKHGPSPRHRHKNSGGGERVWLPRERPSEATATKHPFCVECGTVKNMAVPLAKPIGFYLSGLANLKEYLGRTASHPKLAQVHRHLISVRLAAHGAFEDSYGTPGAVQLDAYVSIVRSVRSDLDEEIILRLLPGNHHHRHSGKVKGAQPSSQG